MKISRSYFMSLEKALKLLPGVRPRKAGTLIKETFHQLAWQSMDDANASAEIGGRQVSLSEIEQLVIDDFAVTKVSPQGATLLIDLYKRGGLPMEPKQAPVEQMPLAEYAGSEADLLRKQAEDEAEAARRAHMVDNPAEINESEFDYGLLNDVFFRHRGPGSHVMTIGGIEVHKFVIPRSSNSGKSRDSDVSFKWTDSEGQKQEISKESRFANNRRNDPDRNWGLGRE